MTDELKQFKFWQYLLAMLFAALMLGFGIQGLLAGEIEFKQMTYYGGECLVACLGLFSLGIGYGLEVTTFAIERWPQQAAYIGLACTPARLNLLRWSGRILVFACCPLFLTAQTMAGYDIWPVLFLTFINILANVVLARFTNWRVSLSN
jgi:hypothetical protein